MHYKIKFLRSIWYFHHHTIDKHVLPNSIYSITINNTWNILYYQNLCVWEYLKHIKKISFSDIVFHVSQRSIFYGILLYIIPYYKVSYIILQKIILSFPNKFIILIRMKKSFRIYQKIQLVMTYFRAICLYNPDYKLNKICTHFTMSKKRRMQNKIPVVLFI